MSEAVGKFLPVAGHTIQAFVPGLCGRTGSPRADLVQLVCSVEVILTSPMGTIATRFNVSLLEDPELAGARRDYWRRRFELAAVLFERARPRGELSGQVASAFALELLVVPLFMRALVAGKPEAPDLAERIVDAVLDGRFRGWPAGTG